MISAPYPGAITPAPSSGGGSSVNERSALGAAAASITISDLDIDTDRQYNFTADVLSNANSNRIRIFVNADSAETDYDKAQIYQNGATSVTAYEDTSGNATVISGTISDTNIVGITGTVRKFFDGTNTRVIIETSSYAPDGRVSINKNYRTFSGDVNITAITLSSNQTDGLDVGTSLRVWS